MSETTPAATANVGLSVPRPDGAGKVTGAAKYIDDLDVPGAWHGAAVRSPHAAARIVAVDASAATAADPDVVVVTGADVPAPGVIKLVTADWPVIPTAEVNHVGEAVALVAAPTAERAWAAAQRIAVRYEERPAVLTIDEALAGDPRTGGELNVLARCDVDHGDVEAALAAAELVLEGTYETGHQEQLYIETNGMIARWHDDGSLEVIGSLQCPYFVHKALVYLFGETEERIRIRQATTGGGFGGKEDYPDLIAAHAALLARAAGRPVKIVYDRHEDIIATTKRHPARVTHRTGFDREGKLLAMDIDVILDGGAYTTLSPVVLSRAVLHASGPYRCDNVRIRGRALATNTATNGAFRGFGAPQTIFAMERQLDRIARVVGLDPLTIRERNAYELGDVTPTGQVLDASVSARECLRLAAERSDFRRRWQAIEAERAARPDDGEPWRGIGLSLFWHGSGFTGNGERMMKAKASVRLAPGGRVEILTASTDIGQGTAAVFPQVVADAVGIDAAAVSMHEADTAVVPDSGPTVASRTVMVVGGVLERAGFQLRDRLIAFVADQTSREATSITIQGGQLVAADGTDLGSFASHGDAYLGAHGELRADQMFRPADDDAGFDEETYRGVAYTAYGWGADVLEVEVDPDTLITRPVHATLVCDVGKAINPVLCKGQIEGGSLQAIAWGYLEEIKLEGGRYLNDRLATYIIPTTKDTPTMDTVLVENPAPTGPQGAKGVGEIPMDGGAPALVQAIENATGIVPFAIPATPERLLAERRRGREVGEAQARERSQERR